MVKIDGNRVYPDEVTRQILSIPRVIEATVIGVPADGEYRLIAFICHGEGPRRQPEDLMAEMSQRVPNYMIPTQWIELAKMPRTANGKVDIAAIRALLGK
jgi:acyl-coenzyme A synthetase/AMP-(fatty) acid ligase